MDEREQRRRRLHAWRAATKLRSKNCTAPSRRPCWRSRSRAVGGREVAEEVAADTWLGCWRSATAFRGDSRVLTWLLGIAKRQAYVRVRRTRLAECPLDEAAEALADGAGDAADSVLEAAGVAEILAALDALPVELAETVRLAWLHELPYAEIAAM